MDRFCFEKPTRDFINTAVEVGVIDAVDVLAFAIDCGLNGNPFAEAGWQKKLEKRLIDDVLLCAFNQRHCPEGGSNHKSLCILADKHFAAKS